MDTKEKLIAAARSVAKRRGVRRLGLVTFLREAGIGAARVYDHFESWPALCEAAGLVPNAPNARVPDEEIFLALREVFLAEGGIPTRKEFARSSPFSDGVIKRRFPSWLAALAAFRRWAAENAPEFPYTAELDARLNPLGAAPPEQGPAPAPAWPSCGGRSCGDPLGFRALLHAPVNEQGVVLLFGMVAGDLGYRIETVATGFPDCTAKRRVAQGRWESVRVEFEYRSSSFRHHGHDAEQCDVIVCWEHDWPDCPLEVLALRPAIAALPACP